MKISAFVVVAAYCGSSFVQGASPSLEKKREATITPEETVPHVIHAGSRSIGDYHKFAHDWRCKLTRDRVLAAWQLLVEVKIPGVALDQRFKIKGQAFYVSPN